MSITDFQTALKQIEDDYKPLIDEAQRHLEELTSAYHRRKHVAAVEYGYTNDVIKVLKLGFEVIETCYEDGSWWLEVGGATFYDYDDLKDKPMLEAFDEAKDLGLIEEDYTKGGLPHVHYRLVQID